MILNGRMYVPCEFIDENFGAKVDIDSETNTVKITSAPRQPNLTDYFPAENMTFKYNGGFEGGGYTITAEIKEIGKAQVREISTGGTLIKVYRIDNDEINLVFVKEEYEQDKNYLDDEENRDETILKGPAKPGTTWEESGDRQSTITGIDVSITTPAGKFSTIEVTTTIDDSVITKYYAAGIGLVKSVYLSGGYEMVSELIDIEHHE
jgi:hypothetical protein